MHPLYQRKRRKALANARGSEFSLAGNRLVRFVRFRPEVWVAHQNPRASVPAQDRVVIAGEPQFDGLLVALHGLNKGLKRPERRVGRALAELRVSRPLPD